MLGFNHFFGDHLGCDVTKKKSSVFFKFIYSFLKRLQKKFEVKVMFMYDSMYVKRVKNVQTCLHNCSAPTFIVELREPSV